MTQASIAQAGSQAEGPVVAGAGTRPLRIWPVIVLVALSWACRLIPRMITNAGVTGFMISAFGPLLCTVLLVGWWLLASRARWWERLLGLAGIAAVAFVVNFLADPSLRNAGMWMF